MAISTDNPAPDATPRPRLGDGPTSAPTEVVELVAGMLGRAHLKAVDAGDPDQARAILRLAHEFADEFEINGTEFERLCFIQAATQRSS